MFYQRLFTRILFSLFIGSLCTSFMMMIKPEMDFKWLMASLWGLSIGVFVPLSFLARKKQAEQEQKMNEMLDSFAKSKNRSKSKQKNTNSK